MSTYADEVKAGIELLNKNVPRWRDLVDPDNLHLKDCKTCVLGQVFGDYDAGLNALGLSYNDSDNFGFSAPTISDRNPASDQARWGWLTRAWKAALRGG